MRASDLGKDYQESRTNMIHTHETWRVLLDIAYAKLSTEKGFKSRVREGSLSSLILERSSRVVAQLPTGRIRSLSRRDQGKAMLMDLVWTKYVIPNAKSQWSFMTKLRMWDYYSLIYGAMPVQYDYRVDEDYVGPDFRVINPTECFPQVGNTSLNDCDAVYIVTYHSKRYLQSRMKFKDWNRASIQTILNKATEKHQPSDAKETTTNLQQERGEATTLHQGHIALVTRYERGKNGRWITFAPDFENAIVRNIKNPHESGRIPVVFKYAIPLIDSLWGMGDVERGASLQRAIDTSVNLNLDFSKFKIFPPMWYKGDAVDPSLMRYEPGGKIRTANGQSDFGFVNPGASPSNEFQATYQFLKGALLNQNGTTDTTISASDGLPGFGRTPEALSKLEKRENARDQWDRNMFEEAYEELVDGMINLIGTKQSVPIKFHVFDDEILDIIKSGHKDLLDIFDSAKSYRIGTDPETGENGMIEYINAHGTAEMKIDHTKLSGKWMYRIDAGTTAANDQKDEYERVYNLVELLSSQAGAWLMDGAQEDGRKVNRTELLDQLIAASGIKNKDKIFDPYTQENDKTKPFTPEMLNDPQIVNMLQQQIQGHPEEQPQVPQDIQQNQEVQQLQPMEAA